MMTMPVTPGYIVLDPRVTAAEANRSSSVLDDLMLAAISPGDRVKLLFEHVPPSEKWGVERMWVAVEAIDGSTCRGSLVNRPFEPAATFHAGQPIEFERYHIIGVERSTATHSPAAGNHSEH